MNRYINYNIITLNVIKKNTLNIASSDFVSFFHKISVILMLSEEIFVSVKFSVQINNGGR